ncbi:MAG TPA: redoxin domain-containing protein [Lacipirellulaceae bacterium]|mgnify:CR=1 FL=1|nr:redoxin domain-containing protein [Lacipirellulaceae bacterium]
MQRRQFFVATFLVGIVRTALAADEAVPVVDPTYRPLAPHRLLALLHAPEVHAELKLSEEQVAQLETWFAEVDGPWFRSRIQSDEIRLAELDRLESATRAWLAANCTPAQQQRVLQLEWQSLGPRLLLRNDLARALGATADQQREFATLAAQNDETVREATQAKAAGDAADDATVTVIDESAAVRSILTPEQQAKLGEVVGPLFDTRALRRIYPMAPELVPCDVWINSAPMTLAALRGQVVLVHFYAFQCSNCHANFDIYRRWHQTLRERGVVVLGIQTPETATERDPDAVRRAATERGLEFPIIVDLESANWKAWGNTMWPTVYVVDKRGYIRHWWQGELNWQGATGDATIEEIVESALAEAGPG